MLPIKIAYYLGLDLEVYSLKELSVRPVSPAGVHTSLALCEKPTFNMEKIHGWTAKKRPVQIAGTEFYVISYAGLVFGNNIVHSI